LEKRPGKEDKKSFLERLKAKLASFLSEKRIETKSLARMRSGQFGTLTTIAADYDANFDNIRKWHTITASDSFRKKFNIRIVNEIKRVCFAMHLPANAEDMAISIYRKARIANITSGRRFDWIAAASVYAACRVSGFPRSLEEFAKVTELQPKNIGRTYLAMKRTLKFSADSAGPATQVHRIALTAGMPQQAEELAVKLLENQQYGGKPTTLAATALYVASLATDGKCTQSKLAKAAGIDVNSIRNCYQQFKVQMAV
jgi:transcription initiation factor TFIIB